MSNVQFDYSKALEFIDEQEVLSLQDKINNNYKSIYEKTGKGSDFLGWVDLPSKTTPALLDEIEATASTLRTKSEVCVIVGIGGSYLGARAVIEALSPSFSLQKKKKGNPVMLYAGHNISEDYLTQLLEVLNEKEYSIVVISKSGTTTEPALAFRLLRRHLEEKYGTEEAATRIVAITDKTRGALKQLATEKGYQTYVVPDDVGGRYSVLTPVGLLPIAIAGFDIKKLVAGAQQMEDFVKEDYSIGKNPVSAYAAVRNVLYNSGKAVEIMVNYEPNLYFFTEWWKQLYGESEGKENKGIFPAGVSNTTDLHSMGQYIQEGVRILFETVVSVKNPDNTLLVPEDSDNLDKLNYLAGKRIHEVNKMAELGTTIAHVDGGVPNLRVSIPEMSESVLGELIYFYEMACAVSGYLLDVNPFDQPGVEAYKRNMFALLGKPGFESETEAIEKRLNQ